MKRAATQRHFKFVWKNPGFSLVFSGSFGGLGFYPEPFQLQRSDQFLAIRQERDFSHSVLSSLKLKHRFGLCPTQNGQMHTDFYANASILILNRLTTLRRIPPESFRESYRISQIDETFEKICRFQARIFFTFGYLGFNPRLHRSDLFFSDRQEQELSHSVVTWIECFLVCSSSMEWYSIMSRLDKAIIYKSDLHLIYKNANFVRHTKKQLWNSLKSTSTP